MKAEESKSIAHLPWREEQEEVIHIIIMVNVRPSNQAEQTTTSETPPGSYAHLWSKDKQEADPAYTSALLLLPQQQQKRNWKVKMNKKI